jgi:hypothetical protein
MEHESDEIAGADETFLGSSERAHSILSARAIVLPVAAFFKSENAVSNFDQERQA